LRKLSRTAQMVEVSAFSPVNLPLYDNGVSTIAKDMLPARSPFGFPTGGAQVGKYNTSTIERKWSSGTGLLAH
jgi:hypothetical protein